MNKCFNFYFLFFVLFVCSCVKSQDTTGVSFTYSQQRINDDSVLLNIKATVKPAYKLYALQQKADDVLYSSISFDTTNLIKISGNFLEKGNVATENDTSVKSTTHFFTDTVLWQKKVFAKAGDSSVIKGIVSYLVKYNDEYIPGEKVFKFYIHPSIQQQVGFVTNSYETRSLWKIFITAFLGGLLALLTPCVYSMIPITVSFFTKRSQSRAEGIKNALIYSVSIIVIFTIIGFLITLIFGPTALNNLATNWIANLIFFIIFIVFGISFLGAFEITLPSSWSTKSDSKAGIKSVSGIFFMALTLVVVSFSCTGPIIGNLLVLAAKGNYFGPLTGMFGFSFALALPFALFAFFPNKLNVLGKAGGWLNAVKVTLGFLELALALKFLSNADLSKGWRILDREIFICLWIVIFILLGIYLLGKIKFHHDDELPKNDFGLPHLSVTRLFFAIAAFTFSVYMVPGLWGAPLKGISAFLPPLGTQDFNASSSNNNTISFQNTSNDSSLHPIKYYNVMKKYEPEVVVKYGMITYFDYDEALAASRKLYKPLMLDFTGINCVNCRKMEGEVWSDPQVMKTLKEDFVIVSLYVDVQNIDLPESEQYFSKTLNKQVETLGDKNADLQVTTFGANTQPYYFFLDAHEKRLAPEGYGYDADVQKFLNHLNKVKAAFKSEPEN